MNIIFLTYNQLILISAAHCTKNHYAIITDMSVIKMSMIRRYISNSYTDFQVLSVFLFADRMLVTTIYCLYLWRAFLTQVIREKISLLM